SFSTYTSLTDPATTGTYTLSLHDALPISRGRLGLPERQKLRRRPRSALSDLALLGLTPRRLRGDPRLAKGGSAGRYSERCDARRSEEHTSELQSLTNIVCSLLLEQKKRTK